MSKPKSLFWSSVLLMALPMLAFGQKSSKVPKLSSLSPNSATAGSGNIIMTVNGSSFTSGTTVQWNGAGLTTTFVSSTQLQASVPMSLTASAGTANVTAYTSGKYGGTSNILSFSITAPPPTTTTTTTTTTTSTTPLSITTSSVQSATAGTSYNTSFAGSGGTPAYVWSIPSGGGSLPPGLILATTGTLTGTPTTAGTYSFTVQAEDSAATKQTAQKVFSMSVAAPPTTTTTTTTTSSSAPLFQTGFGTTDLTLDAFNRDPDTVITLTPPPGRSGSALQIHYTICGASDGTCGGSSQDKNRWASKIISPSLNHAFMRGSVYLKSPENGIQAKGAQRKLIWLGDETSATSGGANWDIILTSFEPNDGVVPSTFRLAVLGQGGTCYGSQFMDWMNSAPRLNWDTWYELQIEVQTNTPTTAGPYDGIVRVWLNGTMVLERTDFKVNGACTTPLSFFSVGRQVNRYYYQEIDEYRFWDDIAIGTSYIP